MKHLQVLFIGMLISFLLPLGLYAQNDLKVAYNTAGVPDLLNLCGESDTVTIIITNDGINEDTRTNIVANVKLNDGIRITELLVDESTSGVSLNAGINTDTPQFAIPNMSPNGLQQTKIVFLIKADCSISDALAQNPNYDLKDVWTVDYEIAGAANQVAFTLSSYRAALRVPELLLNPIDVIQKVSIGDCTTRTVKITNSGLDAYLLNLNYQIIAPSSLSYKAIRVNGASIDFTKNVNANGDTIITVNIIGDYFINNTLNGGPSNSNTYFDSNEELTIEEDLCVVNCDDDFMTTHSTSYGCFGGSCAPVTKEATLEKGQANIGITFNTNTVAAQQEVGYCKTGIAAMRITNNGVAIDPGFANIFNLQAGIAFGADQPSLSAGGLTIQTVKIQGITINDANVIKTLDNNPAFSADPDGAGGLADLDGDGFFDDLPEGESIEVVVEYDFNCGAAANLDLTTNCDSAFYSNLSAFFEYDDPCLIHTATSQTNFKTIINQAVTIENYSTTDVEAGSGDVFYLKHQHDRRMLNFDRGCTTGFYYVQMVLPQGITLDAAQTTLVRSEVLNHPLVSNTMSNDTLLLKFDPLTLDFLTGDYDLQIAFTADCNTAEGQLSFVGEFGFMCDDCSCKHIWYCAVMPGTYVHVNNPPCPTAPTCDNAIKTGGMDFSRTTFGFTDSTYTTPIDPTIVNKKSALNCDTMRLVVDGVAGAAFNGNDIGIDFDYGNPLYLEGTDDIFSYGRGYLSIKHGATTSYCEIPKTSLTKTAPDDVHKHLDFSLLASLQACGITIQPGDSVSAHLFFLVEDEGPYYNLYYLVPDLRAGFYVNNGGKITCGDYGDLVKVGKNRTLLAGPTGNAQPSGCDTTYLDYKLIPINIGYPDVNPGEYRPSVAIDSVTFDYEEFLLNGFEEIKVQAAILDHPYNGDNFYDIGTLNNSGHFVATFDTLNLVPSMLSTGNTAITIRFMAIPKCESMTGSFDGDNKYDFDANIFYKANYHAFNISNGACVKDSIYNSSNDIKYSKPPEIIIENLGAPIADANGDKFTWTIRHCNSTNYADANVSWVSIEDFSSPINILSMEDISDPNNILPLTVNNDGNGGFFANTNGLLKAIPANSSNDICNIIRIKGQLTDCGSVSATIKSGWNCTAFNPPAHNFCAKSSITVHATSTPPMLSIIQTSSQDAVPFCDEIPMAFTLKNTQKGRDYNVKVNFTLPQELNIVPGSFEIAWPVSTAFVALGSEPTFVETTIEGNSFTFNPYAPFPYLTTNGLPGVSTTSVTDSNQIAIRYRVVSDCGFTSGRSTTMQIVGEEFCGDPTETTGFVTFPHFISGNEPDPDHALQLFPMIQDTVDGQFPVSIEFTNTGNATTDNTDKIKVILSAGVNYVANSATSSGWTVGEPTITNNNGITTLLWDLPQGMTTGQSNAFDFQLDATSFGCSIATLDIGFIAIREVNQLCSATNTSCTLEVVTGPLQTRSVIKRGSPIITIDASVSNTFCAGVPVQLLANGSNNITWIALPSGDTIGVGNPLSFAPTLTLDSLVATATGDMCSVSSDTLDISMLDAPTVTLPEDATITDGDTIQIIGTITNNIPSTFTWIPPTNLSDVTITNPLAFPNTTTTYVLQATADNGCVVTDSMTITVLPDIDTVPCPIFSISRDDVDYFVVCGLNASFPLNFPLDSLTHYNVMLDGTLANDLVVASSTDIGQYTITGFEQASGPFDITWQFDDNSHTTSVNTINDLIQFFAVTDTFGNWFYDSSNQQLWGGISYYDYGNLTITNSNGYSIEAAYTTNTDLGQSTIPLSFGDHQLIVFDTTSVCADTINVHVACKDFGNQNSGECISETIYIDQHMSFCYDIDNLPGNIISMTNICANTSPGAVDYVINDTTLCMEYTGLTIGSDSACLVFCDDIGMCDTVNFCTSVIDYNGLPIANFDSTCTYMNTPLVFDILANDTTWGGIDTLYFVNEPLSGKLTLNLDNTITYIPNNNVCERTDRLQYIVCNANGCDDAFIDICIECDDIVVFSALSPNGDGVNDVFYIANIENYPNNTVSVYNRWGNRIYNKEGYTNTWDGNWVDNKIIPDGTYYYVIRLNDKDNRVFKGYLQVIR